MLSHVKGPTDDPLLDITIGQALDSASLRWGDRPALVDCGQGVRLSWRALRQRVDELAAGLLRLGLAPGQRIGVWSRSEERRVGKECLE